MAAKPRAATRTLRKLIGQTDGDDAITVATDAILSVSGQGYDEGLPLGAGRQTRAHQLQILADVEL